MKDEILSPKTVRTPMRMLSIIILGSFLNMSLGQAQEEDMEYFSPEDSTNIIEELNPFDPNIESILEELDQNYYDATGELPYLEETLDDLTDFSSCRRSSCNVWARVNKSSQRMELYVNGGLRDSWAVSTGVSGYGTPNFDRHPNGRIYDRYSSVKYPGGDYKGLGNMPYAVFIQGGFALHGTPKSNWKRLGSRASHGCIRMHPDNAYVFNRLVREYGIKRVWITVN